MGCDLIRQQEVTYVADLKRDLWSPNSGHSVVGIPDSFSINKATVGPVQQPGWDKVFQIPSKFGR